MTSSKAADQLLSGSGLALPFAKLGSVADNDAVTVEDGGRNCTF